MRAPEARYGDRMSTSACRHAPAMVVSDVDGTLLDAHGAVSARNVAALERAAAAGSRVVIATGRPVYNLTPVLDAGFTGIAVCMNGAVVYDIAAARVLSATVLEPTAMRSFVADVDALGWGFTVAAERSTNAVRDFWAEESYAHPWDDVRYQRATRREILSEPAVKLLLRYERPPEGMLDAVRRLAAGRVSATDSSGSGLLEVAAAGVNKGATLAGLATGWGIDASDVVAFGDMPNDVDMLAWAGMSVAMANGHPEVLAAASEVGPHHAEDGVAQVLERWF